ncbi:MAG: recombination protein RecR [Gemmatimonadetes bacterium]|nr:MAG: recombination protein RecR [Gemmatimonadota bacterium]
MTPSYVSPSLNHLIEELMSLPGIGRKTAQRLAFYILKMPKERSEALAESIINATTRLQYCSICGNLTEQDPCAICSSEKRTSTIVCVVESPSNVLALEKMGAFRGKYHVLHGVLSPLDGVGPDDLNVETLLKRIPAEKIEEIVLAINPNVEGEATAFYLAKLLKPLGVHVTRIAHGLPAGGDLEYADEVTLTRAFSGRQAL